MNPSKVQVKAVITSNSRIQGDYFRIDLNMPQIPSMAQPGQFIHVQIPQMKHRVLRRPFSIFDVNPEENRLSLIYKVVGEGSEQLSTLPANTELDILGPLGTAFSPLPENAIIVAGGYGCAATHLLAKQAKNPPVVLIGGRTEQDILLVNEYTKLGCQVLVSTDDGSCGMKGRVTQLLETVISPDKKYWLASCGPIPMLKALAQLMSKLGIDGELSLDKAMCCGVGACFACVTKVKADNEDGWKYVRVCSDGPVFPADQLVFD